MSEPLFSIVIATYRRPRLLAECLASLAQVHFPPDRFEVIVVDDEGGLREADVLAPTRGRIEARLIQPGHGGPAVARNSGAARARGRYLYFVDDDCRPAPDCLQHLAARLEQHPCAAVAGRYTDQQPDNLWSAASQAQLEAAASYYNRDPQHAAFGVAGNLAVPARSFAELGGFASLRYSEDREFLARWLAAGRPLLYAAEVVAAHRHPTTLRAFWWRNVGYGQGAYQYTQRCRGQAQPGPRIDWAFYAQLVAHPFQKHMPRPMLISAALVLARFAYLCGYLSAKWQRCR